MAQVNIRSNNSTPSPWLNVGGFTYYSASNPFIDIVKRSDTRWSLVSYPSTPSYVHADGWLYAAPDGTATDFIVVSNTQDSKIKAGTYVVLFPSAWTVAVPSVSGVSNQTLISPGRYEFDATATAFIYITFTNSSGVAQDMTSCNIFYKPYETRFNNGEIFDPDFLTSLSGAVGLRFMDWFSCNGFGWDTSGSSTLSSVELTDFHAITDRTYQARDDTQNGVPPAICAELAKALGVKIWITMPAKATHQCAIDVAQAIYNVYPACAEIYNDYPNEPWNSQFLGFAWLRDTGSVGLTIVDIDGNSSSADNDKIACAVGNGCAYTWSGFESVWGASKIKRTVPGWMAVPTYLGAVFQYTDTVSGQKIKDLAEAFAIGGYFGMLAGGGVADVGTKYICDNQAYNFADSWWIEAMSNSINTEVVAAYVTAQTMLNTRAPSLALTMYEGGQSIFQARVQNDTEANSFTISGNTLLSATDITAGFSTAEQIYLNFNSGNRPSSGLAGGDTCYVRVTSTTTLKLYPTSADATNDTNVYTLDGPAQAYLLQNYTRVLLIDTKVKALMNGTAGATLYALEVSGLTNKSSIFNQFVETGGFALPGVGSSFGFQWGLKASQYDADTPRATYFRSLN